MKVLICIPAHNLEKIGRDLDRIDFSLYSISLQSKPANVVISCSSVSEEFGKIAEIVNKYDFAKILYRPAAKLNIPRLLNDGFNSEPFNYGVVIGTEIILRSDFVETALSFARPEVLQICLGKMMPKRYYEKLTPWQVKNWSFGSKFQLNGGGIWANGTVVFHRDLFQKVHGFNEHMSGYGGMDNDFVFRCQNAGARTVYIQKKTEIIHMWHPSGKTDTPNKDQLRNWEIRDENKRSGRVTWD